jgi:hypothetical protein
MAILHTALIFFKFKKRIIRIIMNARRRKSSQQLFRKQIHNIITNLVLTYILHLQTKQISRMRLRRAGVHMEGRYAGQ